MKPNASRAAYSGERVRVTVERWDGREREIVEHPGAVAIVAVDRDGSVVLVRQLREATRRELVELPAGTLEENEAPLATAKRELAEETGLVAGTWEDGPSFYSIPGFCRERVHLFFASDLSVGEATPRDDEAVALVHWPINDIEGRLAEVEDGKTLVGLLLLLRKERRSAGAPQPTTQPQA